MSRFLLIGLDGAEPTLLERWMQEGRLPNLKGLAETGSFLRCKSTTPCATFPAWTTCVTGVNPGRHGIVDFTFMPEGEYGIRFTNATLRGAPALWNVLSEAGKRVCVLGVPATYPPEPVNGILVSGFDSPVCTAVDRSFVYPEREWRRVQDWRFADFQETDIGPGWHEMAHAKLLEGIANKERIARDLLAQEPWDFFMLVFGESDTVAHHFWSFHDAQSPRHQPGHSTAIREIYERLDTVVGNLIDAAGEDVVIGVVSDHGFGGSGTGVVHLNNWLAEAGHLGFAKESGGILKQLALRYTPDAWKGTLFRHFRKLATRAESASRFSGIDWSCTRAWSEELNYFPSVRVNLKGREPLGQVAPDDYDVFCADLCDELEAWEPIAKAWRREELYQGPYVNRAPDIVLELALENGYSHSCLRSRGGPSFRRIAPDEYLGGKERGMTGNHRPEGVLMLSEASSRSSCSLLDVAPTVYAALEVSPPEQEGESLLDGRRATQPGSAEFSPRPASPYDKDAEAIVEKRLRDLGYFE